MLSLISLITGLLLFKPLDKVSAAAPTATIVMDNASLKIGTTSQVTFTFSEAVQGLDTGDLTVENGTLTSPVSSDGGVTWKATFTPNEGVQDAINLITLDNSGIMNGAQEPGMGTTTSNNYAIDTVRPTATIAVSDRVIGAGKPSQVTITFSEAVVGFTLADLLVSNGTLSNLVTSDNITYTATLTPAANITAATNVVTLVNTGVMDSAGNVGMGTTPSNTYAIDTVPPTASILVSDTTLAAGETSQVTITFSEAVTGLTNTALTVSNGTLTDVRSSDGGLTWIATLTPAAGIKKADNYITLDNTAISDIAGNPGIGTTSSNTYAITTIRPTATIVVADTSLTIGKTSLVIITFSEAVTGFTNGDLMVSNGTLSSVQSADNGVTWTAMLTPQVNVNKTVNYITLQNDGVSNADGNAGQGTTNSNPYSVFTVQSGSELNPSTGSQAVPSISTSPEDHTVISTTGKITVPPGKAGRVSLGKEVQISIPAGVSSQELTLSIDKVPGTETLLANGEILISPVFELLKNSPQNFLKPVKITFAFQSTGLESDQMTAVFYYDEMNKAWIKVNGGIVKGDQISVEVSHFTKFAVLAVDQTSGEPVLSKPTPPTAERSYNDIQGHWAETEIKQASEYGIITGYPDGTFRPEKNVTRAEFMVMLMSALKSKQVGAELPFTDTTEIGARAKTAVSQAVQSGIISGYQDGSFRPNAYLTRAEMAKMVANALDVSTEIHDAMPFADETTIPSWAKASAMVLKERGIVKGMGANEFKPSAQTTRAEVIVLIMNMLGQADQISK
ncbi:hypothetical protein HNR77_000561 [Paenibacillus sp. JGP012]|nr:hypothetical protein [Paenibacillus sp. JGP012]